jgi:hypothetical protein
MEMTSAFTLNVRLDNIIYKHYSQNLIKFQLHPA